MVDTVLPPTAEPTAAPAAVPTSASLLAQPAKPTATADSAIARVSFFMVFSVIES